MFRRNSISKVAGMGLLLFCLAGAWTLAAAQEAQAGDDLGAMKLKAGDLMRQQKYTEALPLLEKIAAAEPDDAETQFYLGFALIAQANNTTDGAARKALRVRARNAFIKSKQLGNTEALVDALIQGIPPDGADGKNFSSNPEADKLMNEAEALFSQGKLDDALVNYQKALRLDPKLYEAALFSGDVYTQRGDFQQAEVWYKRAIEIDPTRETAYRYSATPLMRQQKYDEARDRYIEAYITEPYSRFTVAGLTQWAQTTGTSLSHPQVDIPGRVTFDEKGNANVEIDAGTLLNSKEDGSSSWVAYGITRSVWRKEKFAKTYPGEKVYRHSLAEEADALRSVLALASADKKVKALSPSLAILKRLNDDGLLEAYILMARPDQGIAQDHPTYLRQNRDKLRRYVVQYVLSITGAPRSKDAARA